MIPLFKVHTPPNIGKVAQEVFDSGVITEGKYSDEFESKLSERFGAYTSLTNSGTSALTLAYRAAGVGPDTEVITTPQTCMATNEPLHTMGAKIVWADIDPRTGNICPESVRKKMSYKTVAVVGVHWSGLPFDVDAIYDAISVRSNGVVLISDAAHAFGSRYKGKPIGSECDFVAFSYQAIKHLTTVDGGAITCQDRNTDNFLKKLRWFGLDRKYVGEKWSQDVTHSGYKFHMNNLNAAIGLEQLKYVDDIVRRHKENGKFYDNNITNKLVRPLRQDSYADSAYWIYTVLVDDRDAFRRHMNERGVACDIVHFRNDKYSVFKEFACDNLPGADEFCSKQINVPVGWWLSESDRQTVLDAMNSYGGK